MTELYMEVLPRTTRESLTALEKVPEIKGFYLAGGTGLALQLGHRLSEDLDLFRQEDFDEEMLLQSLSAKTRFELGDKAPRTVHGTLDKTKLSFIGYRYPLLFPLISGEQFPITIADMRDIACMKLDAIASRGTKRDFVDVYMVAQTGITLSEMLALFEKKFAELNYNLLHVKKSLIFFDDAEGEPMPRMIRDIAWADVKSFFKKEVRKI